MPPRIRSPTPSDQEDQLASSSSSAAASPPPPPPPAAPTHGLKIKFKLGSAAAKPPKDHDSDLSEDPAPDAHDDYSPAPRRTTRPRQPKPKPKPKPTPKAKAKPTAATRRGPRTGRGSVSASVSATHSPSALSSEFDDRDELASSDEDDDQDEPDLDLHDDDDDDDDGDDDDDDQDLDGGSDGYSSEASASTATAGDLYGGRKTARQRAKELGGDDALELMSLPNHVYKMPPPVRSEAEMAELRAEKSRKRKSQADKKLEDEKTETINRLLNKQVGRALSSSSSTSPTPKASASPSRAGAADTGTPGGGSSKRSRSKLNKSITAGDHHDDDDNYDLEEAAVREALGGNDPVNTNKRPRVEVKPLVARWISSIRADLLVAAAPAAPSTDSATTSADVAAAEPTYRCTYSLPESRASELASFKNDIASFSSSRAKGEEGEGQNRTRVFSQEERDANRTRNREGWRAVLLGGGIVGGGGELAAGTRTTGGVAVPAAAAAVA
ncbi:hypothetical protein JCM3774_003414 [Rhodotorula dairenensis]